MIKHGKDGWRLSRYDWDEETGWGTLVWTRVNLSGQRERHEEQRFQPAYPSHVRLKLKADAQVAAARQAQGAA